MSQINVVYNLDANYLIPFCVSLTSMLKNSGASIDEVFLIHDAHSSKSDTFKKVQKFILRKFNKKINEVVIQTNRYDKFCFKSHITKVAYYLFSLPEYLPEHLERVLYIDPDTVILSNLAGLSEYDFDDETVIFAVDHGYLPIKRLVNIRPDIKKYFNSGVLWIDLKKWRAGTFSEELWKLAMNRPKEFRVWNQDIINTIFWNRWKELPYRYNSYSLRKKPSKPPMVIHYITNQKPWKLRCDHQFKHYYWLYLAKTPFFGLNDLIRIPISLMLTPLAQVLRWLMGKKTVRNSIPLGQ